MSGKRQAKFTRKGCGQLIASCLILASMVVMSILMLQKELPNKSYEERLGDLETRVYQLQRINQELRGQLNALQEEYNDSLMETPKEGVPREPNAPGSSITREDLYAPTDEEFEIMTKILYREARGVKSKARQAAVIWCILNRVDDGQWGDTIKEVAIYPGQFAWIPDTPVDQELRMLVADVCERWNLEKAGAIDVGRTLPRDYLFFHSNEDHTENLFTQVYKGTDYWDWSLPSPYNGGDESEKGQGA